MIIEIKGVRYRSEAIKYVTCNNERTQLQIAGYDTMAYIAIPMTQEEIEIYHKMVMDAWASDRERGIEPLPVSEIEVKDGDVH